MTTIKRLTRLSIKEDQLDSQSYFIPIVVTDDQLFIIEISEGFFENIDDSKFYNLFNSQQFRDLQKGLQTNPLLRLSGKTLKNQAFLCEKTETAETKLLASDFVFGNFYYAPQEKRIFYGRLSAGQTPPVEVKLDEEPDLRPTKAVKIRLDQLKQCRDDSRVIVYRFTDDTINSDTQKTIYKYISVSRGDFILQCSALFISRLTDTPKKIIIKLIFYKQFNLKSKECYVCNSKKRK